jgi:16S rRNA (guanine527-N7)-methyltransferase
VGEGEWRNFRERLKEVGIELTEGSLSKLVEYHQLLLYWGKRISLVSKRELGRGLFKHYADALLLTKVIKDGIFVDVGTGAGLPGIPIAILRGDLRGILVEVNLKKSVFLKTVLQKLELRNLELIRSRFEDLRLDVQYVITKAIGKKQILEEHVPHLLKRGGTWIRFRRRGEMPGVGEKVVRLKNPFRKMHVDIILRSF